MDAIKLVLLMKSGILRNAYGDLFNMDERYYIVAATQSAKEAISHFDTLSEEGILLLGCGYEYWTALSEAADILAVYPSAKIILLSEVIGVVFICNGC